MRERVDLSAGPVSYGESGDGPPLVFVHGLLTDGSLWRKVVPRLEDRFRCIVPDWPLGSHREPMREDADLTPPGAARLIGEFLDRLSLDGATLVANDTGGALAQMLVADHPERIARLVLTPCDAFDNFLPPLFKGLEFAARVPGGLTAFVQPLRFPAARRLPIAFGFLAKRPIPKPVTDEWVRPFLTNAGVRRDTRRLLRGVDKSDTLRAAARLNRFERPVLIAWATEDKVFPLDHARRLAQIFPDARLEEVADSRTYIPEDQPERLAELVGEFAAA